MPQSCQKRLASPSSQGSLQQMQAVALHSVVPPRPLFHRFQVPAPPGKIVRADLLRIGCGLHREYCYPPPAQENTLEVVCSTTIHVPHNEVLSEVFHCTLRDGLPTAP